MPSSLHKTTSTFASSLYLNGPLLHLSAFTASARRGCVKAGLEQRSLQQRATTIFYCKTSSQRGLFQARFKSYGLNKNRININPTHAKAAGEEVGIYKTYKKGVFCFMSNQLCDDGGWYSSADKLHFSPLLFIQLRWRFCSTTNRGLVECPPAFLRQG